MSTRAVLFDGRNCPIQLSDAESLFFYSSQLQTSQSLEIHPVCSFIYDYTFGFVLYVCILNLLNFLGQIGP